MSDGVVVDMRIIGAEKLYRLAVALDGAPKEIRKEIAAGLRRAISPMQRDFRGGALGFLPFRGGLAEFVAAGMRFRSTVNLGDDPLLRISAGLPGHDLEAMNRGRLRHPVYGNRHAWVSQLIRPEWWDDTGYVAADRAWQKLDEALDIAAHRLEIAA